MISLHRLSFGRFLPAAAAPRSKRVLVPLAALVLVSALAGCANTTYDVTGAVLGPDDYRYRHPILIDQQLATLDVPVGIEVPKLAPRMVGNITGFAQKYRASGAGTMAIIVPSNSPDTSRAQSIARQTADALVAAGVPRRQIDVRTYPAGAEEVGAPVRLAFARIGAHVDGCGQWPMEDQKMWMKTENRSYYNFGCATQQNLAATTANPLDLLYPRGMTPADATRRMAVLGNYQQGTNPSATYAGLDNINTISGLGGN
ncbi:CpaD family pilus assembly protein [Mesorhizobium sp. BR1-1-16]|uniref:CpaD family pilus assembly protein n=1 Tax=Mesorhizobium sp. BR1-1-16 TaxID=2876653 RepID=UPI001CCBABCD|nr:CpaD family pilus assembly protein [Mesorhizobium sp. BR1-1-16]MBZ9938516.1 CpaD family pilus assembly protein [Mesorhizobium sp. BR1-1-16]